MSDPRTNWAKTLTFTPTRSAESARHPATFQELRQRVGAATEAGRHVHAVGSFWSFTGAAAGAEVSLGPAHDELSDPAIDGAPDGLKLAEIARPGGYGSKLGQALLPAIRTAGRAFARVGCLVSVKEAVDALEAEGLGLVTMGSRTGQRVVGVISTGTHGGDFDLPPIADTVRAIHLITHAGTELWIEPASARITADSGVKLLDGCAGVTVRADDGLFRAALVAVGSLGVIASVVLEVRPMYALSERSRWMRWDDVRAKLADGTAFTDVAALTDPARPHPSGGAASGPLRADGYRHLEVLLNPYPDRQGVRWAYVCTRVEHPTATAPDFVRPESAVSQVAIYIAVESGNPERYHDTLEELIGSTRTDTPAAHRYLSVQDTKGRKSQPAYSSELVLSTKGGAHLEAIDEMLAQIDRLSRDTDYEFSGFLSLRFTRASQGLLAMQASSDASERFCHVEVFALQEIFWGQVEPQELEGKNEDYLDAIFEVAARHGGRTHWGQWAHPEHPHAIAQFPGAATFLDEKRALAGEGPVGLFDNAFTVRAGLVPLDGWALVGDGLLPTGSTGAPFDTRALRRHAPSVVTAGTRWYAAAASGDGLPALSGHDGARATSFAGLGLEHGRFVDGEVALAANHDGRLELFARTDDGRIQHAWARKTPNLRLTALEALDGDARFGASPAVARDRSGCLVLLAVDTQRRVLRRRQRAPGSTWRSWETTGSPFVSGALAVIDVPGTGLVVAARDTAGKLVLGAQTGPGQDDGFAWHTLAEACDAEPGLVASPSGVVVAYFQGGVFRALALPAAAIASGALPATTPISSPTSSRPLVASRPAMLVTGSELLVAYPVESGALALHRHALAGGTWLAEQRIAASLVSAVSLLRTGDRVTAVGKLAHDLVIRRVVA
jgi:hypothetical protein